MQGHPCLITSCYQNLATFSNRNELTLLKLLTAKPLYPSASCGVNLVIMTTACPKHFISKGSFIEYFHLISSSSSPLKIRAFFQKCSPEMYTNCTSETLVKVPKGWHSTVGDVLRIFPKKRSLPVFPKRQLAVSHLS